MRKKYFLCLFFIISFSGMYSQNTSTSDEINNYYNSGLDLIADKKFEKAFEVITLGLEKSEEIKDQNLIAYGHFYVASYYQEKKEYLKGIESVNNSLALFKQLNNKVETSNCYNKLGLFNYEGSQYDMSLENYFKSLEINEQLNDESRIAFVLRRIASVYLLTTDYDKLRINIQKATVIYTKMNDELGLLFCLTTLAASYQKEGFNKDNIQLVLKAIKLYKKGLEQAIKLEIPRSESIFLGNIGSSYRKLGRYNESLEYLFRALRIKINMERYTSAAHTYNDISETYIKMNKLQKAKEYAIKAVEMANGYSLHQERYAYYILSNIEFDLGNYKSSKINLEKYHALQDSIFSIEKIAKINEMQIKYETEKKTLKIRAQESDIALLNEKNKVKNQYMMIGSAGLLALFGFVLLFRSRKKQKQRQQLQEQFSRDLMRSQEEERTRIAKELHDSVGQQLTLIKKKSQNAMQEDITTLTHNALEEVRSISRGLYPAMLKQLGLKESIEQLVYEYDEESGLFFTSEIDDIDNLLDEVESLNFYRFIQECLTNIMKHAEAKTVSLSIKKDNKSITTILEDNGKGFDKNAKQSQNSLGLKTIAERISMFKGKFSIESKAGKGTKIFALIPITI